MAHRIDRAVLRGEIDNTVEGRTVGRLWLVGREEPVTLELIGDCWRDLAGAKLLFANPAPGEPMALAPRQEGVVGDMTASRKFRVPLCELGECLAREAAGDEVPVVWKNSLYLEWFSRTDGRVVIETCDYELTLCDREWSMDADDEEAQKLANLQAMRDFLASMIARPEPGSMVESDDEFGWERRLQQSDRLTDAYQEVLEKYMDDPDAERKEAFVMGWDGVLGAMAEEAESRDEFEAAEFDEDDWADDEVDDDELFRPHPLQEAAQELAIRAIDLLRAEYGDKDDAGRVLSAMTMVAAKLAGALNGSYERESGYVMAILKRCLNYQNDALSGFAGLLAGCEDGDERRALESLRDEVFVLRGRITEMRRELKGH